MAKEMRALLEAVRRPHAWVGIGMFLVACTDGKVPLTLLGETNAGAGKGSEGQAGKGGGAGGTGNSGGRGGGPSAESRAGAGGMSRLPPTPCDGFWEPEAENALRDAFNDAIDSGRLCPRESSGLRRSLIEDADLQWQARFAICVVPQGRNGWAKVPRSATVAWVLYDTASLEDAKKALLESDDRTTLCDAAESTSFRAIGVGHVGESWSVFISPGPPEDMRRDDMQKP